MQNTEQSTYTERVQKGLYWFNEIIVGLHIDMQALKQGKKYCCLGSQGGSP